MATTFEVLAEPRRREILDLLRSGERPVGDLVDALGRNQPAVSKHLKVLREAGLVEVRHDAQRRWYRLRPGPLAGVDAWLEADRGPWGGRAGLEPYRDLWRGRLDALEAHLDQMDRTDQTG